MHPLSQGPAVDEFRHVVQALAPAMRLQDLQDMLAVDTATGPFLMEKPVDVFRIIFIID